MNDTANEPSKPASAEAEFRKLSDKELRSILEMHEKWLAAEDKTGLDHLRADLSKADLRRQDAILRVAQLQGAYLGSAQLEGADLARAQLQRADFNGARLRGARLGSARLEYARLNGAQLQGADLMRAQLQGAIFHGAQLEGAYLIRAQLQGATLDGAQLREADLQGAQLQGAHLTYAQLQRTQLEDAQLQGANLVQTQMQRANLFRAQLQGTYLSHAKLQQASLFSAKLQGAYLDQAQLQGASLKMAYLRNAVLVGANFERLEIEEDGEPAREHTTDLTDADFRDADLSNAQLSTVIGLRAEMLAGAVLTNAKLPDDVARFDQLKHVEETSRNASTVFFGLLAGALYSWLTIATTTDVALITGTASSPLPIINTNIALSGFYLAAPLILIAVYFYFHLYLQRLWVDLASLPAKFPDGVDLDSKAYPWLLNGLVRTHFKKLEIAERPLTRWENFVSILLAWWVVPFTLVAFWLRFLPRHDWWVTTLHVALIAAAAWFGVHSYQLAVQTLRGATATKNRGDPPLRVRMWRTIRRYRPGGMEAAGFGVGIIVMLSVSAAIKPGDDWLTALWSGLGYETYAELTDDDVSTKPSGWTGRKETADLEIAQVKGADLEYRDLRNARANGAFLVKAKLWGADLSGAFLGYADLRGAFLWGADLSGADLRDADLRDGKLGGADLSGAILWDADLRGAILNGADLRGALLRAADLSGADLSRADLRDASGLSQDQLSKACGAQTRLPEGLTISTCPVTAPPASPSPPTGSS